MSTLNLRAIRLRLDSFPESVSYLDTLALLECADRLKRATEDALRALEAGDVALARTYLKDSLEGTE